ncbi:MAG: hypothetical protein ABFR90_07550 [Planctomycetota bacterium]
MITLAKIKRFRRFFARHRFLLHVESVLAWLILVAGIFYAISFFIIPAAAESKLEKLCGGAVDIQSGRLKGFGAIRLAGVVIAEDSQAIFKAPILQADRIDVGFGLWQLLRGRFKVDSVVLSDFFVTADYNPSSKKWNLGGLSFPQSDRPGRRQIPPIQIQRGAVRLRQHQADTADVLAIISINGQVEALAKQDEYSFMLETDGRFGFGQSKFQGTFRMGDEAEQSELSATGHMIMPGTGILRNKWNMKDVRLEAAFDEKTIAVRELSFSMGDGHAVFEGALGRTPGHPIEVNIDLQNLTLSDRFLPDTVGYGRLHEFSNSGLTRFLDRFHPAGRGDLKLAIKGDLDDLSAVRIDGLIRCLDISVCDDRFPYPLENMQGEIEFTGQDIRLNNLQSQHKDVQMQIDGTLEDLGPNVTIDIGITSSNMRFDDDLYKALSESAQKVWFEFSPTGRTGVDYRFKRFSNGQTENVLALDLDNSGAVYKHFPYPMENLTGTILAESHQLQFKDIYARYDDGRSVRVDGQVIHLEGSEPVFHVTIQAEKIPVDPNLIRAMPAKQQDLFEHLQAQAVADVTVDVFPNQTDRRHLDYIARINMDAETFLHKQFPLPMTDVSLKATVTQDVVRVDHFEARTASGSIRLNESKLWPKGTDTHRPGMCLDLELENFDLNDDYWKAVGPDANSLLGSLRAYGAVDINGLLEINLPPARCAGNNLTIDCNNNLLLWDGAKAGIMDGRLRIEGDTVRFSDFNLKDVRLESLPPDRMSPKIRRQYTAVRPRGSADIAIREGFLETGREGLVQIDMDAKVDLENITFENAGAIRELDGVCEGRIAADRKTGTWQTQVRYDIRRLLYDKWLITHLAGNAAYEPNSMQLVSEDLQANFYCADVPCKADQVTGKVILSFDPEAQTEYKLELNYTDVDVQKVLAASGRTGEQSVQGLTEGNLVLVGNLEDLSDPRGKFTANIQDMKMGRQSLLGMVLTAVQFKQPEEFVFSEIELAADVRGAELIFDRVRMVGDPLVFHGSGKVNLKTHQIEMELAAWDRVIHGEDTVLDMLVRGIGSALWKVQIHGDLDAPDVDAVYLSVLKQPLDIFKKKQ